jgi:hypothetical protein
MFYLATPVARDDKSYRGLGRSKVAKKPSQLGSLNRKKAGVARRHSPHTPPIYGRVAMVYCACCASAERCHFILHKQELKARTKTPRIWQLGLGCLGFVNRGI